MSTLFPCLGGISLCSFKSNYGNFRVLFTPEQSQVKMASFCHKTLFVYMETAFSGAENGTF